MKSIIQKIFSGLIIFTFLTSNLCAQVRWEFKGPSELPWLTALDIITFDGWLYVCGLPPRNDDESPILLRTSGIFRSQNGTDWETVESFQRTTLTHFNELNGVLYVLGENNLDHRMIVYRTTNGTDWEPSTGNFDTENWTSVTSYKGSLYAATNLGTLWKTDGLSSNPEWSIVNRPDTPQYQTQLTTYNDQLYQASIPTVINLIPPMVSISRSSDGLNWIGTHSIFRNQLLRPFVENNGILYLPSISSIFKTDGMTYPGFGEDWFFEFFVSFGNSTNSSYAAVLHDTLYLFGSGHDPMVQVQEAPDQTTGGSWEPVGIPSFQFTGVRATAHFRDWAYMIGGNLVALKKGLLNLDIVSLTSETLNPGEENIVVFLCNADVNFDQEKINQLVVENRGTAISGRDIKTLRLTIENGGVVSFETELIDTHSNQWTLPNNSQVPIKDGDVIKFNADISATPSHGATIQLGLVTDQMTWEINQTYAVPADFGSPIVFPINVPPAPAPELIQGVNIFPQPAKNHVRFQYSLDSTSDINIKIYNRTGTLVSEIEDKGKSANPRSTTTWNTSSMATNVYFAVIEITSSNGTKKLIKEKVYIQK